MFMTQAAFFLFCSDIYSMKQVPGHRMSPLISTFISFFISAFGDPFISAFISIIPVVFRT